MGLDMWLNKCPKEMYVYRDVSIDDLDENSSLYKKLEPYIIENGDPEIFIYHTVYKEVAYWRKANAIHNWFVRNVQNGIDNCDSYEVSKERLIELREICKEVLENSILVNSKVKVGTVFKFENEQSEEIDENEENEEEISNPESIIQHLNDCFKNGTEEVLYEDGQIIINPEICMQLLPTCEGFFFGGTDYNQFYIEDVKYTLKILTEILDTTDFEKETVFYTSSW